MHNEPDERDAPQSGSGGGRLLLVGEDDLNRLLGETLEADGHRCDRAPDAREARRQVLERRYDAIVLDLDTLGGSALEVVQLAVRLSPATVCILRSRTMAVESVLAAMRAGLGDFLGGTLSVPQIRLRLRAAVRRSREMQQRLEHMCRLTVNARRLSAGHASLDLDGDAIPSSAEQDPAVDAPHRCGSDEPPIGAASAPEGFVEAARQQLDPEGLVTASIQHLVDELGPVNVAVYLGTGSARFGLAAYARADLPRAAIEHSLRCWSEDLCREAAADGRVQSLPSASALARRRTSTVLPDSSAGPGLEDGVVDGPDGTRDDASGHDAKRRTKGTGAKRGRDARRRGKRPRDQAHDGIDELARPSMHDTAFVPALDAAQDATAQRAEIEELETLNRHAAVVVPCKAGGVCDAVLVILAPANATLRPRVVSALADFGETFALQLARIQRIHSRALPSWPTELD